MSKSEAQIASIEELGKIVFRLHVWCHELCKKAMGCYLPIAGNVGIFCQSQEEYEHLSTLAKTLTESSNNPDQKYFKLLEPCVFSDYQDIPWASYEYLYIRKPAEDSPQLWDIDFVLPPEEFETLKSKIRSGDANPLLKIDEYRPGREMVMIYEDGADALPYISTREMAERMRVKF